MDFKVNEPGLVDVMEEYRSIALSLNTHIEEFGTVLTSLSSQAIAGAEAPNALIDLWYKNCGNSGEGLEEIMKGYVTELNSTANKIELFLKTVTNADSASAENSRSIISVDTIQ